MDPLLTPDELEALTRSTETAPAKEVKSIDLVARDHQAFARLPDLQAAADRWATEVDRLATKQFRMACESAAEPVEIVPGSQVRDLVGTPRYLFGLADESGIVSIDSVLGGAYVVRQFGGEIDELSTPEDPPTPTELLTVGRLGEDLVKLLKHAMAPVCSFGTKLESTPPKVSDGVAMVLLATRVQIGEHRGAITIALSTAAADFKLSLGRPMRRGVRTGVFRNELERVSIKANCVLGHGELTVRQFLELQAGDLLTLDTPVDGEIPLLFEQQPKFLGTPTLQRGNLSLEIKSRIKE